LSEFEKIYSLIDDIQINWTKIIKKMEDYTKRQQVMTNKFANKAKGKIIYLLK
jgi:hypothetical protein